MVATIKSSRRLVQERRTTKELRKQAFDLHKEVTTKSYILESKKDYIDDLEDEVYKIEKQLQRTTSNVQRKVEDGNAQEKKVMELSEVLACLETEKTQAKNDRLKAKAKLGQVNRLIQDVTAELSQKSMHVVLLLDKIKGQNEEISQLKKIKVSQAFKEDQKVRVMQVQDEMNLEMIEGNKESNGFTNGGKIIFAKEITQHQSTSMNIKHSVKRKQKHEVNTSKFIKLKEYKPFEEADNVRLIEIKDEVHLDRMECTTTKKGGFTEEAVSIGNKKVFQQQTVVQKQVLEKVAMSDDRRRCTSSFLLRARGRECSGQRGRRLRPLTGLSDYTIKVIPMGRIIHDVVDGIRLVTEGAKAEKVFSLSAWARKNMGLRFKYQNTATQIMDTCALLM